MFPRSVSFSPFVHTIFQKMLVFCKINVKFLKTLTSISHILRVPDVDYPQAPSVVLHHCSENAVSAVIVHTEDDEVGKSLDSASRSKLFLGLS